MLSRSASKYRAQTFGHYSANCCVKRLRSEQSRTEKYAPASQSALNCKKAARKSGFPFACARLLLFPTKRARCAPHRKFFRRGPHTAPLCGDPDRRGCFRVLHPNIALSPERAISRIALSAPLSWMLTYALVRSRVAIRAELQESRSNERLSFCLRAIAGAGLT